VRIWFVTGILVTALGAFILVKGLTYRTESSAVKVQGLQVSVQEHRVHPVRVGGVVIASGLLLVLAGGHQGRA
jgi:hypothetical protein